MITHPDDIGQDAELLRSLPRGISGYSMKKIFKTGLLRGVDEYYWLCILLKYSLQIIMFETGSVKTSVSGAGTRESERMKQ